MIRADILKRISDERERNYNLPGSELDVRNTPNEWTSIIGHYLFENVRRGHNAPDKNDFEDAMVKAAAVIIAALESTTSMQSLGYFANTGDTPDSFEKAIEQIKPPVDLT